MIFLKIYVINKSARKLFVRLAFKFLSIDLNKISYKCTVYHNKGFDEEFFYILNLEKYMSKFYKNV